MAILDRLRVWSVEVESILMDHDTLLAHPTRWVTEPLPTGSKERIRFSRVREAFRRAAGRSTLHHNGSAWAVDVRSVVDLNDVDLCPPS